MDKEEKEKFLKMTKVPDDFELNLEDIKVLGKREITSIIKWKGKINKILNGVENKLKKEKMDLEKVKSETNSESELEAEIRKSQTENLNKMRKDRVGI